MKRIESLIQKLVRFLEKRAAATPPVFISREKLYDVNAAAKRNVVYDKKGNAWPWREAL